jgi:hypothetical protein
MTDFKEKAREIVNASLLGNVKPNALEQMIAIALEEASKVPDEAKALVEWALATKDTAGDVNTTCLTLDLSERSIAIMWLQWAQIALSEFPKTEALLKEKEG